MQHLLEVLGPMVAFAGVAIFVTVKPIHGRFVVSGTWFNRIAEAFVSFGFRFALSRAAAQ